MPTPWVTIPGVHNFRDISCAPHIRSGLVFRSADPSSTSAEGIAAIRALGIRTVFDLRSKPEVDSSQIAAPLTSTHDANGDGIRRLWVPVFAEEDYSPEKIALRFKDYAAEGSEGFTRAYAQILKHGAPAFRTILLYLAGESSPTEAAQGSPRPCLIHCTAGKDRTGVFVAVLLSLLGVDDDAIAAEYSLTQQGLAARRSELVERLLKTGVFQGEDARKQAENMVSAKEANMLATLQMLRKRYGGVEEYVRQACHLDASQIQQIRTNLTTGSADSQAQLHSSL